MKLFHPALLALGLAGSLPGQSLPSATVADLAWLSGEWRGTLANGATFETRYTDAAGGKILSTSKELRGTRLVGFEFEVFSERDGSVVYQPYPNGTRSPRAFPLIALDRPARRATFENKQHDFPQTFQFESPNPDELLILLSGPGKNGATRTIRYALQRVR